MSLTSQFARGKHEMHPTLSGIRGGSYGVRAINGSAPPLLHTNHESRTLAKKTYSLPFEHSIDKGPDFFFDFSRDVLLMEDYNAMTYFMIRLHTELNGDRVNRLRILQQVKCLAAQNG